MLFHAGTGLPRQLRSLQALLKIPRLVQLCQEFLAHQLSDQTDVQAMVDPLSIAASSARVWVYNGAVALYHAPSDPSGKHGMRREWIRCTPDWRGRGHRQDCVLVDVDPDDAPEGLQAARVKLFFALEYRKTRYECALVHWYSDHSDKPDPDTGMRVVVPSHRTDGLPEMDVVHLDSLVRATHLVPVHGTDFVSEDLHFSQTLDKFKAFYINCYIDHHMFDLLRSPCSSS
jgi:hypothetical protein